MPPRDTKPEQGQPDPAATPDEQPAAASDGLRLAVVGGPTAPDSLVVGDGDTALEITVDGTVVPADREDEVRAAAKQHGVTIRKVS